MTIPRDFHFTDDNFKHIQQLVSTHTGISLSDSKKEMVYSRLAKRVRSLNLRDFDSYCRLIEEGHDEKELIEFINSITTNLTSFFRENHHFEYLGKELLPRIMQQNRKSRKIRIWSAGCSTGEEPYSIAIVAAETVPKDWDTKILATDLDSNVLNTATAGVYRQERVEALSTERLRRFFHKGSGANEGFVRINPELKSLIRFKQLNLMNEWPMKGPMDVIFCRNVVIYFDKSTQRVLFERYANLLKPDGHLFVGHSESLFNVTERFTLLGKTTYQKTS